MRSAVLLPTLTALAALPAAPGFELVGETWTLAIEPRLQSRIEIASASDVAGGDYDIWERRSSDNPQGVNFLVRRARLYFKGKSEDGWRFNLTLRADNMGRSGDADGSDPEVYYAWVGKEFISDVVTHYVLFGKNKHTGVVADLDSSSKFLFPNERLAAQYGGPNSVGLGYRLGHPLFAISLGLADEPDDDLSDPALSANNDWQFYARVETSLQEEWTLPYRTESYLGQEGFGHMLGLGLDLRTDGSDSPEGIEDDTVFTLSLDYLLHAHQITALAEVAFQERGEGAGDNSGMIVSVQGGFAFPQDNGRVFEPALRLQVVDNDTDENEEGVLDREGGQSGLYFDVGVNWYLDGHDHKLQAAVQFYTPEAGDGDALVFRLGHNLDF